MAHRRSNTNTSTASHSYSDISRIIHREEGLQRKYKHLLNENTTLQKNIRSQEQQIKQQRKVIIYKINELEKSIACKINNFQDRKLSLEMFSCQQDAHSLLQQMIEEYQEIEQEQKMINRTSQNILKMKNAYINHSDVISNLIADTSQTNYTIQKKLTDLIQEKRSQLQDKKAENQMKAFTIQELKANIIQYQKQKPQLIQRQSNLRAEIQKYTQLVQKQETQCKDMEKWAQIVIDKKKRKQLYEQLTYKMGVLDDVTNTNSRIMLKCIQSNS